jgi:hypothetical protein
MSRPLQSFGCSDNSSSVALRRRVLKKAFRSDRVFDVNGNIAFKKSQAGPFRSSQHLGDPLGRLYQSCGGSNQVNDVNSRIKLKQDSVSNAYCEVETYGLTPLQVPLESGNSKYVCDNSLFIRFKGLKAINQNYADISNGGNTSNGAYVSLMSVRHS